MTDISAAIGLEQLKKLEAFTKARQNNAAYLNSGLKNVKGIIIPITKEGCEHVFHQYTIRVTNECKVDRDSLAKILNEKGIGAGVHYHLPIHKQPYYQKLGYKDLLPVAEKASSEVLSLPVHPGVSKENMNFIISTIKEICG